MEKVLIVDDHPANIRIIAEMLKSSYEILAANNGQRAIKLAEEHHPDIILMDVMMPELDGFSACRILKNEKSTADIPVIFITAKNEIDDVVKGFGVGGCDYITKPFNHDELAVRVETHLELQRSKKLLMKYIKELEYKNIELDKMAKTDYLTGLANRRFMLERIKEENQRLIRNGTELGIIMCDIDHFKRINDTYGHEMGDRVIRDICKIISENTREYDIAARWGGEEFLIILPETNIEGTERAAEKIRKAVENGEIAVDHSKLRVTITLGVSQFDKNLTIAENINMADEALYDGKREGRNRVSRYSAI